MSTGKPKVAAVGLGNTVGSKLFVLAVLISLSALKYLATCMSSVHWASRLREQDSNNLPKGLIIKITT